MSFNQIADGLWTWSWFSQEKGYDFNGFILSQGPHKILIDPVLLPPEKISGLLAFGPFDAIYLSNKDHERMAYALRRDHGISIGIHEEDLELLKEKPDFVFRDGQDLLCGIKAIHLHGQKSPGECAFYIGEKKILIFGDALIGHPAGSLNMLPASKYADKRKAEAGLRRLFSLDFEILLVGDGKPVLKNAYEKLEECFEKLR